MENQKDSQTNKKGNGSTVLIVILLLLVLALAGYICYDKILLKENNTNITNESEKEKSNKVTKEDEVTTSEDNEVTTNEETDNKKYVNKVYANANYANTNTNKQIVLFENGKCVYTYGYNYASKCSYYIEDDKVYITHSHIGTSMGETEEKEVYKIYTDTNNQENIMLENETDENNFLKYLEVK